jgi:hypothetical protein
MMSAPHVIPAKGHPAKYYFAGTPKAGISAQASDNDYAAPFFAGTPAFAGVTRR